MKKNTWIIVVIIMVILIVAARFQNKENSRAAKEPVKIGALFPLTGGLATWGEASRNAAEIAVDEINKNGGVNGRPLVIDYQDHRCDPKVALSIFQQLSTDIKLWLSSACSGTVLSVAPNLEQSRSMLLANVVASVKISNLSPFVYRNWPVETNQAEIIAKEIQKADYKKIAILNEDTDYAKGLKIALEDFLKADNTKMVISESFGSGATDVRTQLTKLRQGNPDILFVSVQSEASGKVVLGQMEQLGFIPKKLAVNDIIPNAPELVTSYAKVLEGALSTNYLASTENIKAVALFEEYKKRYGKECPQRNACVALHDSVYMLAEAIKKNGYDSKEAGEYLQNIRYDGAGGMIEFDKDHNRKDADYSLFIFKNGKTEIMR